MGAIPSDHNMQRNNDFEIQIFHILSVILTTKEPDIGVWIIVSRFHISKKLPPPVWEFLGNFQEL